MATLLLVEDNPHIMKINAESLEDAGYKICEATSLEEAEEVLNKKLIDLIVLDIMLPDGNGVAFCKKIRKYCDIPILFLSAKNSSIDVIEGLHSGGDDYLSKPYNLQVLSARIESLLRRTKTVEENHIQRFGWLTFDMTSTIAYIKDKELYLTQKEFAILLLLARQEGKVVDKGKIYNDIWHQQIGDDNRAFWATMSRLKRKLSGLEKYVDLITVKPKGYKLVIKNK